MAKKRPTIKDVASVAGVSATTVSHVLNDTRFVSEKIKNNVFQAIKKLKYKPNHIARSLRGGGTKTIGVIIADIREEFFSEIVKSIEKYCNEYGYIVFLCDSEDKVDKESQYLYSLMSKDVDGIIISPIYSNLSKSAFIDSDIPIVQIDRYSDNIKSDFIGIDNEKSAYDATNYLIQNNSKNILYIGYSDNIYTQKLRREGFLKAINEKKDKVEYNMLTFDYMGNTELCNTILSSIENYHDIDTVFCSTGKLCYNFLRAAASKKMLDNQSLRIITYDDSKWLDLLKYPIISIKQPTEQIGKLAVETLIKLLDSTNNISENTTVFLDTEFMPR